MTKKQEIRNERRGRGLLARLLSDRKGNTLAIVGAALVPIAGIIGSGLDMARAYMAEAKLQNACDAGALAARRVMQGADFTDDVEAEGERFFDFNFPADTMSAQNVSRTVSQDADDETTVVVTAGAEIPTTIMQLFGKEFIPIAVVCNADNDFGNNDIMLVLDVTGSMNDNASGGGGQKIERLRSAAVGIYNALASGDNTRTRFGIMPYSQAVNVGASLPTDYIRRTHYYWKRNNGNWSLNVQNYTQSQITNWHNGAYGDIQCVDERSDIAEGGTDQSTYSEVEVANDLSQQDIDAVPVNSSDYDLQWGVWNPLAINTSYSATYCPAQASKLAVYNSEDAFNSAISTATQNPNGNTYHDIGMIWGMRFVSSSGMFASDNPTEYNGIPVRKHLVFLTDGDLVVAGGNSYTAYGIRNAEDRVSGPGGSSGEHAARFLAACNLAAEMGITVWVIALDVTNTDEIEPCASSDDYYFESDGSDLEDIFARIGQGIARLRLTQ